MLANLKQGDESPAKVNLPQREDKTRDASAAEIAKAADTSNGSTGRAQGDARRHYGCVIGHSRSGECQNPNSNLTATTSTSTTAKSI